MTATFTIDRMGHQGDGIADAVDGPVFAPGTLPGETVRGLLGEDRRLTDIQIIEPSADRRPVHSEAYAECGVAPLQHWAEEPYLAWKRSLVVETLRREGLEAKVEATVATPPATRRRLALHARRGPKGRVLLGFKARKSWRLVEITDCPVSDPRLTALLPALARVADPFLSHPKSAPTLHVTLTDTGVDVDITGVEKKSGGPSGDAAARAIAEAAAADLARLSLDGEVRMMARQPRVTFGRASVPLPPGGFLQASPQAEAVMVERTMAATKGAKLVADLFCGAGTFTFPLAEQAKVIAADSSGAAIAALKAGIGTGSGLRTIEAQARDLFRRPLSPFDLKGCEAVVFDPPRAGALEQARQIADAKAGVVVGVSCNPTSFARDARILVDAGFLLETVTPIDQFVWSTHVELVGVFRR
ncbi:class I SAM-dependent RNA methyltransferase [Brevundimonas sp. S30B]|uniref:class I SAM-dependent RNA methyltransferase n=1 Tax=unclassified Brevundimonas TaxID=2622653 RepID=UPI0010727946|nr:MULTISPECIES: class I SAM-dependent RNA methyltransferase [unclassified Brevundimonas]QBX37712.1 class I SAM-dependent RNA methyltransferase [Brevundimonas sp. MF30-B]TFW00576.1 class I SAM-dependent RNA methyltransferase [Brevundimonas sp. S30B]